jgi:asparagine synthase (glutamine-hydrolysing)
MLTKVDLMSMANSLEVRTPFLDVNLVDFVFTLPDQYKIQGNNRKKILKDTFSYLLPEIVINRRKKGFEVPLLKLFKGEMYKLIFDELLSKDFICSQGIFNYVGIDALKRKLFSGNPDDSVARIWGLVVFQYWWKKYHN